MRTSARPSVPFSSGQQLSKESTHPLCWPPSITMATLPLSQDVFLLRPWSVLFRGIIYPLTLMKFCSSDKRTVKRLMWTLRIWILKITKSFTSTLQWHNSDHNNSLNCSHTHTHAHVISVRTGFWQIWRVCVCVCAKVPPGFLSSWAEDELLNGHVEPIFTRYIGKPGRIRRPDWVWTFN